MTGSPPLVYLTRDEVRAALPSLLEQVNLVDETYRAMARGQVELPPKPGIHPRPGAFIHAMPAYLRERDVAAVKWVAGYPDNPSRGLPYISGILLLNDPETGVPTSIMDAAEITAARTAAASGVCIRAFAPEGWSEVAILGFGEQGRFHARVVEALNPSATVRIHDPRITEPPDGFDVTVHVEARSAVDGADVVITAGPIVDDPTPPIARNWVGDASLLLPIDFDFYVQPATVEAADLFVVDDIDQFEYYRTQGHFTGWPRPPATVGQALERGDGGSLVVACNLGVGSLDAAFAQAVLEAAQRSGAGATLQR